MPWFDPPATVPETTLWVEPGGPEIKHKVGRWPHPNTPRAKCGFIMPHGAEQSHTAYRRLFLWAHIATSDPILWPKWQRWGHWDLEVSVPGTVEASVPANEFGWDSSIKIESFASLPFLGVPGVELELTLSHDAEGHFKIFTYEYREDTDPWHYDEVMLGSIRPATQTFESAGYPYTLTQVHDYSISDCYPFPRAPAAPSLFAEMNGVDSFVQLDTFNSGSVPHWRFEFDVRMNSLDNATVFGFTGSSLVSLKIINSATHIQWRGFGVTMLTPLTLGQWHHIDFDSDWINPAEIRTFLDGVPNGVNLGFVAPLAGGDQFGRSGSTIEGNFDLRNMKFFQGTQAAPILEIDCPFTTNACDVGPQLLGGTAINMSLPSCPP